MLWWFSGSLIKAAFDYIVQILSSEEALNMTHVTMFLVFQSLERLESKLVSPNKQHDEV